VFQPTKKSTFEEDDPVYQMHKCKAVIIGAINGFAITGGFELALACDILLGNENAKFMDTHAKFGLMPSWGLSQKLSRIVGIGRAKQISLTAKPLDAKTAEQWGLLNYIVPKNVDLLTEARRMAMDICSNQVKLVKHYKRIIDDGYSIGFAEGMALERQRAHDYYAQMTPEEFKMMKAFIEERRNAAQQQPASKL